jgi:hypothetical protein
MPMSTPTSNAVISVGAASLAVIIMASMPIFMTLASFMSLSRGRGGGGRFRRRISSANGNFV